MPLYEYKCDACGTAFEVIQRFSDPPVETCRTCGGAVHKMLSAPAIQFKGTGWYVTDYAKKGAAPAEPSSSSDTPPASAAAKTAKPAASDAKPTSSAEK